MFASDGRHGTSRWSGQGPMERSRCPSWSTHNTTTSPQDGVTTACLRPSITGQAVERPGRAERRHCAILVSASGSVPLARARHPSRRDVTRDEARACSETLTGGKRLAWPSAFRHWHRRCNGVAQRQMFAWCRAGQQVVVVSTDSWTGGCLSWHSRTWAVRRNGRDWQAPSAGTRRPRANPGMGSTTVSSCCWPSQAQVR